MSDRQVRELARELVALDRRVTAVSTPQLGHSSLEDASINEYDADGQLTSIIGRQYDGTHGVVSVAGPTPPKPTQLTFTPQPGGGLLKWDGLWEDSDDRPTVAPQDFKLVELHASTDPAFTAFMFDTKKADILNARGGEVLVGLPRDVDLWFRAIARSQSGKVGLASDVVGPFRAGKMVEADTDIDFSKFGGTLVHYGSQTPVGAKVGDLWYAEVGTDPVTGKLLYETRRLALDGTTWAPLADQGSNAALAQAILAINAANSKAKIHPGSTRPTGLTADDAGDLWFDPAEGNTPYVWDGDSWEPRLLGNGAIQPQSLVASDVFVTGTVTASLLEAIMVLATLIILGDPDGEHTRVSPAGIAYYAEDPVDGIPNELARWGRTQTTRDPLTGAVTSFVNEAGEATYRSGSFDSLQVGGQTLAEILWEYPWGSIGRADVQGPILNNHWSTPRTNGEVGLAEFAFIAQPGREYELSSEPFELRAATGDTGYLRVRYTTNGTTPTVTSPKLREAVVAPIRSGFSGTQTFAATISGPPAGSEPLQYRLLMTYGVGNGSTGVSAGVGDDGIFRFSIQDTGPTRPNVAQYSAGSGTVVTGETTPPPPPASAKTTRTTVWYMDWSRSWRQNGSIRTDVAGSLYQGYGDSFNGINGSAMAWLDITGALAGAQINKVELYLRNEHSWNNSGMQLQLGTHGSMAQPALFPGQAADWFHTWFNKGQGRWLDISQWGARIQSGAVRGLTVYANTTNADFYGRFSGVGQGDPPQLRITYTK